MEKALILKRRIPGFILPELQFVSGEEEIFIFLNGHGNNFLIEVIEMSSLRNLSGKY